MGSLLKIAIFAVAAYVAWTAVRRWLGFGGPVRTPAPPRREAAPSQPRRPVVEDTHLCTVCGAYVSAGAARCSRPDCPQP
jgi:hypothetical protein